MSAYKVISNNYVDFLDYMNNLYRKNNGDLNTYFAKMTLDDKTVLIDRLAFLLQRMRIVQSSQEKFYNTKKNNSTFFMILLWVVILVSGLIMFGLLVFQLKNSSSTTLMSQKIQTGLVYLITYSIIFGVFFILYLNIKENKKKFEALQTETTDDINKLRKVLLNNDTAFYTLLEFVGYKRNEMVLAYNDLYKKQKGIIDMYLNKIEENVDNSPRKIPKAFVQPYWTFKYDEFYKKYGKKIQDDILKFFNNGEGYETINKIFIVTSNTLMLKEMRNIMKYYYTVIKRKENAETIENGDKNKIDTIDRYVIPDLKLTKYLENASRTGAYIDPTQSKDPTSPPDQVLQYNLNNTTFMEQFNRLKMVFCYTVMYCYQFYLRKSTDDKDFDQSLLLYMIHLIELKFVTSNFDAYAYLRDQFANHYKSSFKLTYSDVIALPKDANIDAYYEKTLLELKQIFDTYYQSTILVLQGDYLFPFNGQYMMDNLESYMVSLFSPSSTSIEDIGMNAGYFNRIKAIMQNKLIPRCYETYNLRANIEYSKGAIVSRITTNISKFDIKVSDYSQYIVGKLQETENIDTAKTVVVVDIINVVDKNLYQKKLGATTTYGKNANEVRFLTLDEFLTAIDDIQYNDLKNGLQFSFLNEILDKFYYSVSMSTILKEKNSKDIYFNQEKKFKIGKVALVILCVILSMGLVHHLMSVMDEMRYTSKAESMYVSDVDKQEANKSPVSRKSYNDVRFAFLDTKVNIVIKGVVPIVGMVFLITLLFSMFKKSEAKFKFNKETIDTNTNALRTSVKQLKTVFDDLDKKINVSDWNSTIKNLPMISVEEKTNIYEAVKKTVDKFEKCNYILSSQKNDLPFPYTETIIDMFMILICVLCILYILGKINPMQILRDMKVLYSLKERGMYSESDPDFTSEIQTLAACHETNMESISFTIKILFFLFVVMFLIFYSTKVVSSTSEFESGIYNSVYFEESTCFE